jgi:ABC-type glycerol-3-phosphate transport system permease component
MLVYQFAFLRFQIGPAAAIASLILLVSLVLGTVAGFVVVLNRLRLNVVETKPAADLSMPLTRSRALPGVVFALLGVLILGICLVGALPFGWLLPQAIDNGGRGDVLGQVSAVPVLINTLVPALIAATLQVLVAYLAALGIGALRPFGKRSEWLLLFFSPWLFVTVLPLSLVNFIAAQKAEMLDTFAGSLSPILFSIPALFILTLFFAGRASQRDGSEETPRFFSHFVLPSLPLAAVLWLALIFFNGQDVFWSLLVAQSPERWSLNVALLQILGLYAGSGQGVLAAAITFFVLPLGILFFIGLALFQVLYLDRLSLYAESSSSGEV